MAQTTMRETDKFSMATNTLTDIPATGNTVLLELPVRGLSQAFIRFAVADQALDAFIVEGRADTGAYVSLLTAITATPGGLVVAASGTLASQAAGTSGWCVLNVRGMDQIRISASAAVDGADVIISASAA